MKRPDFFIVGAPKCGTTAMCTYLSAHPEIFLPEVKEIHFFGSDLNFTRPRPPLEQYLAYFSKAKGEKRIGEASVRYLYSKRAAAEIKEFSPSARIIAMLRNPVDMLYSLHSQLLFNGYEDIEDFEAAWNAEADRKKGLRIPKGCNLVDKLFYRDTVRYTEQVQRYLDAFGWEQVHIIIYDDLQSDTAKVYRETLRFLDVNDDFQPDFRVINPNKRVKSKALLKFLRTPPGVIRQLVKAVIPSSLRLSLTQSLFRLNTKYESRPPMSSELRNRLQAEFAPEVESLSKLLGRDLSHWSKE